MTDTTAAPSSIYRRTLLNRIISPLRNAWRVLTSMRTALTLLFFLAIAAIPGALLPQRSLNQGNVNDFITENGVIGEIYDRLQLFDVFSSWWFTAIYALLFILFLYLLNHKIQHGPDEVGVPRIDEEPLFQNLPISMGRKSK